MTAVHHPLTAQKACARCSTQKRRCDKALPDCGLCTRLRQKCIYEPPRSSSWDQPASQSPRSEILLSPGPLTTNRLKEAIIRNLRPLTPEDAFSTYCREIEPWFPIISVTRLRGRFSLTWDVVPLDVAILCLSVILFTTTPPSSPEVENDPSDFYSLYLFAKGILTSTEGLGMNSFSIAQSRILVNLFEVAHGFYPAAYISMGATVRAAEALEVHSTAQKLLYHSSDDEEKREDNVMTWSAILILDRCIAIESGTRPSLTRDRSEIVHEILKPTICSTHYEEQDRTSPRCRLARVLEASSLLDKVHTALNNPTSEHSFNMEQIILTVQTLANLETILIDEIGDGIRLYSGGFGLCNTALLLAFENGAKSPPGADGSKSCHHISTTHLLSVLSSICGIAEPFTSSAQLIDFNLLPPFTTFLVYKVAAIVTERLLMDNDPNEKMKNLKILRTFLKMMGVRWLGCRRYLGILNEDTTPRTLKALE